MLTKDEFKTVKESVLASAFVILDEVDQTISDAQTISQIHKCKVVVGLTASLGARIGARQLRSALNEDKIFFWEHKPPIKDAPQFNPDHINLENYPLAKISLSKLTGNEQSMEAGCKTILDLILRKRKEEGATKNALVLVEHK